MPSRRPLILLILLSLTALTLIPGRAALGQSTPALDTLVVRLWPEFDQPGVLVFYLGVVEGDTPLPVQLSFTLPDGAALHAVAYEHESGGLVDADYTLDGNTVLLTSPNGTFHLEYYDSSLILNGSERGYTFTFPDPYPVQNFFYEVQQPAGALALAIDPPTDTVYVDSFGLNTFLLNLGGLEAGEAPTLRVAYSKSSTALTVEQIEGAAPPEVTAAPAAGLPSWVVGAAAGLFVLAIGALAFVFGRRTAAPVEATTPAPFQHAPPSAAGPSPAVSEALTDREVEVLTLIAEGLGNQEIGQALHISPKTVSRHRENIMHKLDLHSRTDLVKYAISAGLISLDDGT
jgi:DNA-binding NarL/FixJ family response regulator